jgi:O-antigen ligase
MAVTRSRFSAQRVAEGMPAGVVSVLAVSYSAGVVVLFAWGKLPLFQAGLLLGVPVLLATAVLRPEWTILVLVGLPPSVISVPPLQLVAVMLTALFGFLLQGRFYIGLKTGVYPVVGIIVLATIVRADTSGEAAAVADGMLKNVVFYTLLMLVAFLAVVNGRMRSDTFVNALLLGLVGAAVLAPFLGESPGFDGITQTPYRGQFAYLAVMGFGVTYVRLALSSSAHQRQSRLDAILMIVFLSLAAIGFGRAAWMAGLWAFALVSMWTGRKLVWIVFSVVLVLVFAAPVVGERVFPLGSTDFTDPETVARVTTGRSLLWGHLWELGADALPLGQGWGYIPSLDSTDIFGFEGNFQPEGSTFVHPHNDFLYVFVELGIMGLGLLVLYWLLLLRKIRLLSRGRNEVARYETRVLVPVIIVMFLVQLFDNGFAIRFVAIRFFIAAGLVYGLQYLERQGERLNGVDA